MSCRQGTEVKNLCLLFLVVNTIAYMKHLKSSSEYENVEKKSKDDTKMLMVEDDLASPIHKGDVTSTSFQELLKGNGAKKVAQDDPRLIKYVREHYIYPPSKDAYNLKHPHIRDPAYESESKTILGLLDMAGGKKNGGFFIEAGAADGEGASNTLMFERYLNWTGLLVEPDIKRFNVLKNKNRKSWIVNTALSVHRYPEQIFITKGKLVGNTSLGGYEKPYSIQALPLWTILLAINRTEIDFLSLDVDRLTPDVLKTLPLDKLNIKVAMLEVVFESDKGQKVREYLQDHGFVFHKNHHTNFYRDNRINDIIMYKAKVADKHTV